MPKVKTCLGMRGMPPSHDENKKIPGVPTLELHMPTCRVVNFELHVVN